MPRLEVLEKLDRRWLFLIMGLLVLEPLMFPLALPLTVTRPDQGLVDAIDKVPDGSTVLMSCDYDPSGIPEMVPMTRTAFRHLLGKNCKVVITVLWPGGPRRGESVLSRAAPDPPAKRQGDRELHLHDEE